MRLKLLSKQAIWIILGIPLLSYFFLKPTLNLSLFGDDWEQLYFMWLEFDVRHAYQWLDIKSYLGPYNFSYLYLGILNHFFGLNAAAYFWASFFFRVLCTITIYFLVKYLTKEKLAAFLSSLIFIFSIAGLETTDWVFNMNTYMGISLFNIALICYLKIRSSVRVILKDYIIFITLFAATLIVVSTRMHGAVPFLILLDILLIFIIKKQKFSFNFPLRIITPTVVMLILIYYGAFGHIEAGGFTERLKLGYNTAISLLQNGERMFLLFFPGIIGHAVLPDLFLSSIVQSIGFRLASLISIIALFSLTLLPLLKFNAGKLKLDLKLSRLVILVILEAIWFLVVKIIHSSNLNFPLDLLLSIVIGGQLLLLLPWLFLSLKTKYPTISFISIFCWFWLIAFTSIYWFFNPNVLIETTGRYMIMTGVGFAIFLGAYINYLLKNSNRRLVGIPIIILASWLVINIMAGHQYMTVLETNRNSKLANSIWKTLTDSIPVLDINNPTVFYFTADNPFALHWNLNFGFPPHMGLTYRIPDLNNTPLPVTDYPTLLAYARDGSPQKKNGRPIKPVPLDHIYAFQLINGQLTNQTDLIREILQKDLQKEQATTK